MVRNVFSTISTESNGKWNELIEKIIQGEVVPVIGPEFLAEDIDNPTKCMNPHQALIDMLAEAKNMSQKYESFSEILYDDKYPAREREDIYDALGTAFQSEIAECNAGRIPQNPIFRPSELLIKLLRVCRFRFVITTSFTPLVEYAMREIYGEKGINVMNFNNNPLENQDLRSASDLLKPTVYYMFGRVCCQPKRYVVKDSDMLSFCRAWLREAPSTLVSVLKNKYLLVLGNNYSDWLCRFIWYSMKTDLSTENKGLMVNNDDSLLEFMRRIDAFTQKDPKTVIDKIDILVEEKMKSLEKLKYQKPDLNTDVFLSYSRRDATVVKKLYDALTAKGLRVWYDRENLGLGDKFMEEIKMAIRNTRIFIPILSSHIEEERNESHPYRTEWEKAMEVGTSYGRNFIFPLCEKGFDFYNASIPDNMQKHNAYTYDPEEIDFSDFATNVYNYLMNL